MTVVHKAMSRPPCICRMQVTAVHKANIMKLGDGMFLRAVRDVAPNFPSIKFEEMIVGLMHACACAHDTPVCTTRLFA